MNRKTKGALAAGAGAVLLLGGVGSYALWNDTENLGGSSIDTGNLALTCTAGGWTDQSSDGVGGTTVHPATDLMVPGDTWQYKGTCTPTATGKNMNAWLKVKLDAGTATPPAGVAITTQVGTGALGAPVQVTGSGTPLDVIVNVAFDAGTTGTTSTNSPVSVAGIEMSLDQLRPGQTPS